MDTYEMIGLGWEDRDNEVVNESDVFCVFDDRDDTRK